MRASVTGFLVLGASVLSSCAQPTEQRLMNQPIDMGPYTFAVVRTEERARDVPIAGPQGHWLPYPTIELRVAIRVVRDNAAPFTTDFSSFLIFRMKLEDAAGNMFDTSPAPVNPTYRGGRYHSDEYVASATIDPSMIGVRDVHRLGKAARDFRLIIGNPSPQGSQPRSVSIQLQ